MTEEAGIKKAEWIPAHLNYEGPAKVEQYFDSRVVTNEDGTLTGFFRGHMLYGKNDMSLMVDISTPDENITFASIAKIIFMPIYPKQYIPDFINIQLYLVDGLEKNNFPLAISNLV